jgi:site-specific DNA recombinase
MTALRAAIYGRQSRGKEKSITEQITLCTADAEAEGWTIAGIYRDGTSASTYRRKDRIEWPLVLAAVEAREFDILVMWASSRGDRDLTEWSRLLDLCRKTAVRIRITDDDRTYDLTRGGDWQALANQGVGNAVDSMKISTGVRRGQSGSAALGRPSHGRCPYGYRRTYDPHTGKLTGQEPDPTTAPIVARIIRDVAALVPISVITARLNAEGGRWGRKRVRDTAMNPAYIGRRRYNGQQYDAEWAPLIDAETYRQAQRVLTDAARVVTRPGRIRHLLSYLAVCGACGGELSAIRSRYRCMGAGCGLTIRQADTDWVVTETIIRLVSRRDYYQALRKAGDADDREVIAARAAVEELRTRLAGWRASAAKGTTTPESLAVIEAELVRDIRAAQARAERAEIPPALRAIVAPGEDVRARWDAAPLPARRGVIRAVATVSIMPAAMPGSPTFEPERVQIKPR